MPATLDDRGNLHPTEADARAANSRHRDEDRIQTMRDTHNALATSADGAGLKYGMSDGEMFVVGGACGRCICLPLAVATTKGQPLRNVRYAYRAYACLSLGLIILVGSIVYSLTSSGGSDYAGGGSDSDVDGSDEPASSNDDVFGYIVGGVWVGLVLIWMLVGKLTGEWWGTKCVLFCPKCYSVVRDAYQNPPHGPARTSTPSTPASPVEMPDVKGSNSQPSLNATSSMNLMQASQSQPKLAQSPITTQPSAQAHQEQQQMMTQPNGLYMQQPVMMYPNGQYVQQPMMMQQGPQMYMQQAGMVQHHGGQVYMMPPQMMPPQMMPQYHDATQPQGQVYGQYAMHPAYYQQYPVAQPQQGPGPNEAGPQHDDAGDKV